jgi:hypothetical protein
MVHSVRPIGRCYEHQLESTQMRADMLESLTQRFRDQDLPDAIQPALEATAWRGKSGGAHLVFNRSLRSLWAPRRLVCSAPLRYAWHHTQEYRACSETCPEN